MEIVIFWPIENDGLVWLKEIVEEFTPLAMTLMIPHELISVEQTVIDEELAVFVVLIVIVDPLMLACTILALELFNIV